MSYDSNIDARGQFRLNKITEREGISATIVEFHCLDNVTRKKSYACDISSQIWHLEVMVSDTNKTVSINIIQGLKLILTKGSSASDTEAEVRIEKLWWYRR